ncbi:MAG: hypothetical protein ACR2HV_08980 [Acidimicrobiales bacterium]
MALDVLVALRASGCEAAGYRLAGAVLDYVCCRHLYGGDRMLIAWPADDHAVVILVAPHDRTANDVYRRLLDALDIGEPEDDREKPPCCDEAGQPPADRNVALDVADAVERRERAGRRRAR